MSKRSHQYQGNNCQPFFMIQIGFSNQSEQANKDERT